MLHGLKRAVMNLQSSLPDPAISDVRVKICGLTSVEAVEQSVAAGAAYLGFCFFPPSPRAIDPSDAADVIGAVPAGIMKVALVVDPDDVLVDQIMALPIDMIQLHGSETPQRVAEIRARSGLPVMKAVGVRDAADLPAIEAYGRVADQLLIDAKPPKDAELPGGNGIRFDWTLISNRRWPVPWMLAGGLTADNVAEGLRLTGARQVDVASGVESAPGIKDPAKVQAFVAAAQSQSVV